MFRTFADGDTVTLQIDGESKPKGVGVGTYRCIEGTGGHGRASNARAPTSARGSRTR